MTREALPDPYLLPYLQHRGGLESVHLAEFPHGGAVLFGDLTERVAFLDSIITFSSCRIRHHVFEIILGDLQCILQQFMVLEADHITRIYGVAEIAHFKMQVRAGGMTCTAAQPQYRSC